MKITAMELATVTYALLCILAIWRVIWLAKKGDVATSDEAFVIAMGTVIVLFIASLVIPSLGLDKTARLIWTDITFAASIVLFWNPRWVLSAWKAIEDKFA